MYLLELNIGYGTRAQFQYEDHLSKNKNFRYQDKAGVLSVLYHAAPYTCKTASSNWDGT